MDGTLFDRITKSLFDPSPRREAAKAFAGGVVAAVAAKLGIHDADARKRRRKKKKNKKKPAPSPCVGRKETCGGQVKCCEDAALVACREYPSTQCPGLTGFRCCGLEGAACTRNFDPGVHCECCPGLYCNSTTKRCQETPT